MLWFVQIIFCLYYWDGLISLFFSWWFEVVRIVQLLLNKILQIKKKNQLFVCRIKMWVLSTLRRNRRSPLAWPLIPPAALPDYWVTADGYRYPEILIIALFEKRSQRLCCLLDEMVSVWFSFFLFFKEDLIQDASVVTPARSEALNKLTPSLLLCRKHWARFWAIPL